MKKLVKGILEYKKNLNDEQRSKFSQLALGQSPDTLFVACSDSRVVPNLFASTSPGDLFVVRNAGNMIPLYSKCCEQHSANSEGASVEFALKKLKVKDIVICGHSECGAMQALLAGRESLDLNLVKDWLSHAEEAFEKVKELNFEDPHLSQANKIGQANVLVQIEHLKTHPGVEQKVNNNELQIHGLWFDIKKASVLIYHEKENQFVDLDEQRAQEINSYLNY